MSELDQFRSDVAAWLERHCPAEMRQPATADDVCWGGRHWVFRCQAQRIWLERMVAKGWTTPTWPVEYGGAVLSREQEKTLREEMRRIGARSPLDSFGISMLGPALLRFGTEVQKRQHLPWISRGEIRWCQGYSEPGAGSDLASVQTRAEDHGDHFVLQGQKVWTSYADQADWMFALVRTDPKAPKQRGISFVLFDMQTPGVTTRPIRLISGKSPFCETFLDGVRVPKANVVGEINRGWDVAKYLLTHERQMIGAGGTGAGALAIRGLGQLAAEFVGRDPDGRLADPILRARIVAAEIDHAAFLKTQERIRDEAASGVEVGTRSALLKYYGTEVKKRRHELLVAAAGAVGLEWESARSESGLIVREWLRSKANSIEGGTSEIMLNIIAKTLLELPGA